MTLKPPESSFINPPYKVEGSSKKARASFYELAKDKIKYLTEEEIKKWKEEVHDEKNAISSASFIMTYDESEDFEKWIHNLEIVVNKDDFNINGKDYSDILPFALEHEIYEAWINAKKGVGPNLSLRKKHLLASQRAFLLAEQQDLGDKLFEWQTKINPADKEECEYAQKAARKRLGRLENK